MTPAFITLTYMLPGTIMEHPAGEPIEDSPESIGVLSDGDGSYLAENAMVIFSLDRDKVLKFDEIKVGQDGVLAERIILLDSVSEVSPFNSIAGGHWLEECLMSESYEHCIESICEDCAEDIALSEAENAKNKHRSVFEFGFIGLFHAETSHHFESGLDELDGISYLGAGRVVLASSLPDSKAETLSDLIKEGAESAGVMLSQIAKDLDLPGAAPVAPTGSETTLHNADEEKAGVVHLGAIAITATNDETPPRVILEYLSQKDNLPGPAMFPKPPAPKPCDRCGGLGVVNLADIDGEQIGIGDCQECKGTGNAP